MIAVAHQKVLGVIPKDVPKGTVKAVSDTEVYVCGLAQVKRGTSP